VILVIMLAVSGFFFDYTLDTYVGEDIPWYADCVAGVPSIGLTIPAAVVGYVLVACDIPEPIFCPSGMDK
jgi:hypothetical protein